MMKNLQKPLGCLENDQRFFGYSSITRFASSAKHSHHPGSHGASLKPGYFSLLIQASSSKAFLSPVAAVSSTA
jgi:hypothetical protein